MPGGGASAREAGGRDDLARHGARAADSAAQLSHRRRARVRGGLGLLRRGYITLQRGFVADILLAVGRVFAMQGHGC